MKAKPGRRVNGGQGQQHGDGRPDPEQLHDGRRKRQAGEQAKCGHAKCQQQGVQEMLALLLHFHRQQFDPVFSDGRQTQRELLSCRAELGETGGGGFHT